MSDYADEFASVVREYVSAKISFDVNDVMGLVVKAVADASNKTEDITYIRVKSDLMLMFECGKIPGFSMVLKPSVGADGPFSTIEFAPGAPLEVRDLIPVDIEGELGRIGCKIPLYYKDMLKELACLNGCSQDMMLRTIIVKSLMLIADQLK